MKEYLEEYHDIFFLFNRIKEIDSNYGLFFNKKAKRLEIHNFCQRGSSLVMVANSLDQNILTKLRETRCENSSKLFARIEQYNQQIQTKKLEGLKTQCSDVYKEIAKYSFLKNRDLTDLEFQKFLKI